MLKKKIKKKRHPRRSEERKNTVLINVHFNTILSATFRTAFNRKKEKSFSTSAKSIIQNSNFLTTERINLT